MPRTPDLTYDAYGELSLAGGSIRPEDIPLSQAVSQARP